LDLLGIATTKRPIVAASGDYDGEIGGNLPHCYFSRHKSHMLSGRKPGSPAVRSQQLTACATNTAILFKFNVRLKVPNNVKDLTCNLILKETIIIIIIIENASQIHIKHKELA
jgi:hypothetical protein